MKPRFVSRRTGIIVGIWAIALIVALLLDARVASWVQQEKPVDRHSLVVRYLKWAGNFVYIAPVAVMISFFHPSRWRAGLALILASALSGVLYGTKWIFGRQRPSIPLDPYRFDLFKDGLPGIFYAQRMSMPSGHACQAFAAASCLAILFPRGAVAFYTVAVSLGIERVLEGAHYPSDVILGTGFGVLSTQIVLRLAGQWFGVDWKQRKVTDEALPLTSASPAAE